MKTNISEYVGEDYNRNGVLKGYYDAYVRSNDRIIDLTPDFLQSKNITGSFVEWKFEGKYYNECDESMLAAIGITRGSVIRLYISGISGHLGGDNMSISVRARSIGVQTVAKPTVYHPMPQPPPAVNNPPPAKT